MTTKLNIHQLPFEFSHPRYMKRSDFIKSPCNAEALEMIELWPHWQQFGMCIYGSEHCGKTHLAHIFSEIVSQKRNSPFPVPLIEASEVTSEIIADLFAYDQCLIVENLNNEIDERAFFHLINTYRDNNGFILFTSVLPPARIKYSLPDLASRLNMLPAIGICEPDDELLSALIIKLFMDRQITISKEIMNYILMNMQRSFCYAHRLVEEIDNISMSYKRAISIPIVKEAFNALQQQNQHDLFE